MSEKTTAVLTPEEMEERRKLAQSTFDDFDVDKDGLIYATEVESVFRKWSEEGSFYKITEYQMKDLAKQFMSQADANADAKVTFDEVYNAMLKEGGISFGLAL